MTLKLVNLKLYGLALVYVLMLVHLKHVLEFVYLDMGHPLITTIHFKQDERNLRIVSGLYFINQDPTIDSLDHHEKDQL
jgi:hypothetical protein